MAARVCSCPVPDTALVEGVLVCEKCGERVRDAHEETRDKAIAATARAVANVERQLANGNGNGSNGSAPDHAPAVGTVAVPRIALTRAEAAQSLGCGLTHFKSEIAPQLRVYRKGKVRLYAVAELQRWIEENAEAPMVEQLEEGKS